MGTHNPELMFEVVNSLHLMSPSVAVLQRCSTSRFMNFDFLIASIIACAKGGEVWSMAQRSGHELLTDHDRGDIVKLIHLHLYAIELSNRSSSCGLGGMRRGTRLPRFFWWTQTQSSEIQTVARQFIQQMSLPPLTACPLSGSGHLLCGSPAE
jgi:hypothetical protein